MDDWDFPIRSGERLHWTTPHADLSYIISKRVWREHPKWRGRFMALWRSYRNGGDPEAWYNAHVQVGVEFYKASLGGAA